MPKKVDHARRRLDIARVAEGLVYDKGMDGLTMRDVARGMGCSLSVILHYFESKLDLLVFTHRLVRHRAEAGLVKALEEGQPARACFEHLLPLDEQRWRDWYTWLAFWGMSSQAGEVASEHVAATVESADIFLRIIRHGQARGEIDTAFDAAALAIDMQILCNGLAGLVAQGREAWPAERQLAHFRRHYAALIRR